MWSFDKILLAEEHILRNEFDDESIFVESGLEEKELKENGLEGEFKVKQKRKMTNMCKKKVKIEVKGNRMLRSAKGEGEMVVEEKKVKKEVREDKEKKEEKNVKREKKKIGGEKEEKEETEEKEKKEVKEK